MSSSDIEPRRSGSGWFFILIAVLLFVGGALSVAAYVYAEPELTIIESVAAGFAGLAALIIGLIAALVGIVTAGGAIAMTLFIIGSPIIAIILFVLLLRRPKACPDPSVHE